MNDDDAPDRSADFDAFDDDHDVDPERRRRFERTVPEVFRRVIERALEAGVEKLTEAPENLRDLVNELKLPKEATGYIYDQIDDTKKGVYRIVAKEIRDVLEHINFADEIAEVLTKLQFEVNTTIRFVPNERHEGDDDGEPAGADKGERGDKPRAGHGADDARDKRPSRIPRPQVVSKVVMKAREALKPKD